MIVYPARTIESDSVLIASPDRRVIMKNITYEQSDHHRLNPEAASSKNGCIGAVNRPMSSSCWKSGHSWFMAQIFGEAHK